ncbi:hypothetical protein ACH5RR_041757 [Cinchona calisaya]|uniref:Uncharacterized protein n=1 Tax=Cinchona calisaya TaxID=153742 RepID=A0ABD2XXM5_9GENT
MDAVLSSWFRIYEIDKGGYDEICSLDFDIRSYTGKHLTVFWKSGKSEFGYDSSLVSSASLKGEIQDDIARLLERVKFGSDSFLLQFWEASAKFGGLTVLATAGQPFGLGHFCKGLWRYRKRCLGHSYVFNSFGAGEASQLGPPGRVYENGIPEFCPNIEAYSTDEFPLRDYAINECGIQGYWALPIFSRLNKHLFGGVLEFVALKCTAGVVQHQVNPVIQALNKV